ncbi:hypothetical protein L6773_19950 [Rhodohalobacter sp. WB101]|uniref:Uncharacterized protein n=1 Tax=Rhodohalobacter sulfatireducens TaxID=2911366 RepID=A0ABS9KJ19_9BACT|nr:hypothetical protein [Rhodohalobacter sulfatireducens]
MSTSYKKPNTPYIILIVLFFLLAAFDAVYIKPADTQTVMIKVEDNQMKEVDSTENLIAKYLIIFN